MMNCDPVTGACVLPEPASATGPSAGGGREVAVHYVGDPMCSWCWGISPTVREIAHFCDEQGLGFTLTMGGLRAGGGDEWNSHFKDFLRNEWRHIAQVTGQPFGFSLLDAQHFNYDTEPACRAVTTVKLLQAQQGLPAGVVLGFFSAVQRKFYVQGQDPTEVGFYQSVCADLGVEYAAFKSVFESAEARQAVQQEFALCRQWGVRSFPSLLLEQQGSISVLAVGMVRSEQILSAVQQVITA